MKVIDILNKIANGEEIPKLIKYANIIYFFKEDVNDKYLYTSLTNKCFFEHIFDLNDEVEIIEEDKKIRKLKVEYANDIEEKVFYEDGDKTIQCIYKDAGTELIIEKLNEIIDYINKEKEND